MLQHLELLMNTGKSQNKQRYFTLELTESSCTCITSPAEASQQVSCRYSKPEETNFKMAILGSFLHLYFVPVWLFCLVSGSSFTKSIYSGQTISSFSVKSLCLCEMSVVTVVCPKHEFICLDSSSVVVVRVLHFSASSFQWQYLFKSLSFLCCLHSCSLHF